MSANRARLAFAGAATALLLAAVIAVSSASDEDTAKDPCLTAWNDDSIARSDGVHAYATHGYRATLLTRVDPAGELLANSGDAQPTPQSRCAVVFASPQVDSEPDFGARVLDRGRWSGLADVERIATDRIAELQREATETANVTLLPDGRLAD